MPKTILSIDCGTQSLRVILFSLQGEVLGIEKIPFEPYVSPNPGWAEQDPEIYWDALKKGCLLLKRKNTAHFNAIAGVGVTTIRDSMVNVDKNGNPLRPVIVWLDQRKAAPVYHPGPGMKLLIKAIGIGDSLAKAQRDGKCNWIKQNQPEIWAKTDKYLQVSGFLNHRLTGKFRESVAAQIGHIPFDYKKQKWGNAKELTAFSSKIYPVEKEKLPEIIQPGELIGTVTQAASTASGLPFGLPVIACGSDKGCGSLGMGVLSEEVASLSFGTTATIQITSKKYLEPIRFMPAYPATVPGFFSPEIEVYRGFWMVTWFKNQFAQKEVEQAKTAGIPTEALLDKLLYQSPPGAMGLVMQPFWSPGLSEPAAKGAMIGFGDVHKKEHVYRAIIEGIAFALYEGKEKIERVSKRKIVKLKVSGGGSKSDEICRIAADIFGLPLVRGKTTETSGLGAAIITAKAVGEFSSIAEAVEKMVHYEREFLPNKKNARIYAQLYKRVYKKMYSRLEPLYHEIREITGYPEQK